MLYISLQHINNIWKKDIILVKYVKPSGIGKLKVPSLEPAGA